MSPGLAFAAGAGGVMLSVFLFTPEHWPSLLTALATLAIAWLAFESHKSSREAREREQARLDMELVQLAGDLVTQTFIALGSIGARAEASNAGASYESLAGLRGDVLRLGLHAAQVDTPMGKALCDIAEEFRTGLIALLEPDAPGFSQPPAERVQQAHDLLLHFLQSLLTAVPDSREERSDQGPVRSGDTLRP